MKIPCYRLIPMTAKKLKQLQNKKGQKKFPGALFSVSFSQLLAVEKNTKNGATGKFLGPSYFETALVNCDNYVPQ